MNTPSDLLARIRAINQTAAFNQWCGIEVISAEPGKVEIAMPWRRDAGQYAGFLHAGLIGALIDTGCGFAAATLVGRVLASHFSVNCLRPAVGERFIARARVVKPGKSQVFTACELFAQKDGAEKLVATGETLLSVVAGDAA
ncbi:MAG: PaaI family thioesterase [Ramlibacter sp.]|nr:PaaI family thioesterase [Ramlibacter sp.]